MDKTLSEIKAAIEKDAASLVLNPRSYVSYPKDSHKMNAEHLAFIRYHKFILKTLTDAGWHVEISQGSDQRDGSWFSFHIYASKGEDQWGR